MARFKGLMIYRNTLNDTPIVLGQMVLCPDSRELFFDASDADRVQITDIYWLNTDSERRATTPTENKIYIVRETCHIWTHTNGDWCDLTNQVDLSENPEDGNHHPISSDAVYKALLLKADVDSPILTGEPKTTTPNKDDNSIRIASTAFVKEVLKDYVPNSGAPEFSVSPTAPTPDEGDNSNKLATTEYVQKELLSKADKTITVELVLFTANWNADKTYTVTVDAATVDNPIIVGPKPDNISNYGVYGIKCISQGNKTLTFSCDIIPKEDVTVNVFIFD